MPLSDIINYKKKKELSEYHLGGASGLIQCGCHKLNKISHILDISYSISYQKRKQTI